MEPNRQPTLIGELVELRPSVAEDFKALYAVAQDKQLWAMHPAHDRWQEPVFRAYFDGGMACGGALTIIDRATRQIIGSSRFDDWDPVTQEIEIGWTYIARSHWRRGYNAEAKRLMLDYIFAYARAVRFTIGEGNLRSREAVSRLGAKPRAGTVDRMMAGLMKPHIIYTIARP